MQDVIVPIIQSIISGMASGGLILILVRHWLNRQEEERKLLQKKVEDLSENRMRRAEDAQRELAKRLIEHEKNDSSKEILITVRHLEEYFKSMNGTVINMDGKLDHLTTETARQEVKIDNNAKNIGETRSDLNNHKREKH